MNRINRIKVCGFKASNRFAEADFSQNVSVLFGLNGSGKTSFLKIIHGVLSLDKAILIQNSVDQVDLDITYDGLEYKVAVRKNKDGEYKWDEILRNFIANTSSLSLGVDRGVTNQSYKIDPRYIVDFFRTSVFSENIKVTNIPMIVIAEEMASFLFKKSQQTRTQRKNGIALGFEKRHADIQNVKMDNIEELLLEHYSRARFIATRRIQSALFDTLAIAIDFDKQHEQEQKKSLPDNFENRLKQNSQRIREALDDGTVNPFKSKVIEIIDMFKNGTGNVEKIRNNSILSRLFLNIIEELDKEKLMLGYINKLIDIFNNYLIEGKKLVIKNDEVVIDVQGISHGINELSSGERHILTLLSLILFEGGNRNILIIDEPEISLNMTWQRELISLISNLIPNTQIIVASHSSALVRNHQKYLTELHTWVSL